MILKAPAARPRFVPRVCHPLWVPSRCGPAPSLLGRKKHSEHRLAFESRSHLAASCLLYAAQALRWRGLGLVPVMRVVLKFTNGFPGANASLSKMLSAKIKTGRGVKAPFCQVWDWTGLKSSRQGGAYVPGAEAIFFQQSRILFLKTRFLYRKSKTRIQGLKIQAGPMNTD